ncbi:MAG: hypothetical protein RIR87_710 [Actinomycetota bacterium]
MHPRPRRDQPARRLLSFRRELAGPVWRVRCDVRRVVAHHRATTVRRSRSAFPTTAAAASRSARAARMQHRPTTLLRHPAPSPHSPRYPPPRNRHVARPRPTVRPTLHHPVRGRWATSAVVPHRTAMRTRPARRATRFASIEAHPRLRNGTTTSTAGSLRGLPPKSDQVVPSRRFDSRQPTRCDQAHQHLQPQRDHRWWIQFHSHVARPNRSANSAAN